MTSDPADPGSKPKNTAKGVKKDKEINDLIADFLSLVPDDQLEVPTKPETSALGPLDAARAMATYHRQVAAIYGGKAVENKVRTRAMIILGALVSRIDDTELQDKIRKHVSANATPRDLLAVIDVVEWLKTPAKQPKPTPAPAPAEASYDRLD